MAEYENHTQKSAQVQEEIKEIKDTAQDAAQEIEDAAVSSAESMGNAFKAQIPKGFSKAATQLEKLRDLDVLDQERYYTALVNLRDTYFKEGSREWTLFENQISSQRRQELKNDNDFYVEMRDNRLAMLEFYYQMGIYTEEQYYQKLTEFRDNYFVTGSEEWMAYTKKIRDYNVATIQSAYETLAEYAKDTLGDILKDQETLYKKLDGAGSLMRTIKIKNYYENGNTLTFQELSDISKENDFLRAYGEAISQAAERITNSGIEKGAAEKLYDELLAMDPKDAAEFAYLLTNASDEAFQKYVTDYQENMRLLESVSKNPYKAQWETAAQDVENQISATFSALGLSVPVTFRDIGKASAEQFDASFLEHLTKLFETASKEQNIHNLLNDTLVAQAESTAGDFIAALAKEGFTLPETFADIGSQSGARFAEDFIAEITQRMQELEPLLSDWSNGQGGSPVTVQGTASNVYSPTYHLYGSGETDVQRIQSAIAYSQRERMAGGYA